MLDPATPARPPLAPPPPRFTEAEHATWGAIMRAQRPRRDAQLVDLFPRGLEDGAHLYPLLRDRRFPIGDFVRDSKDLNYTPEPDIVHDLYGHIPFHADARFADYCQRYGELACGFLDDPARLRRLERSCWFTNEFGLVETPAGRRIFGAGIASSIGECAYALSGEPEVVPLDVEVICAQEFRIDPMQRRLFLLRSPEQLSLSFETQKAVERA